jgi:hypothetical protein
MKPYLDRREAAEYLTSRGFKISWRTLQKFATVGGGPPYQHFGIRTVYESADLDEWAADRMKPARAKGAQ